MPELPEVQTTVSGLLRVLPGLSITHVWSDMWSISHLSKNTIKDKDYFPYFKKYALKNKVISIRRMSKYILIDLENGFTVVIHMKMTGHLMYGKYKQNKAYNGKEWSWIPSESDTEKISKENFHLHPLLDPYNRHIHVVFSLSNGKHLVFCDSRKFGTITIEKTSILKTDKLSHLGPEPLEKSFTLSIFKERMSISPKRPIKTVLMDQKIISGIGNIYSDEMLHLAHINPKRKAGNLSSKEYSSLFSAMRDVLQKGINFGGDSMSDYRNIDGLRGAFQKEHLVYLRTGLLCKQKKCSGIITKETVGGRSAHYCTTCQK